MPEGDGAGIKVDLVDAVVPDARLHGDVPLLGRVGHPPEGGVAGAAAAAGQAVLQLGEVRLEEGDLVLARDRGAVGVLAHEREVVVQGARGDGARVVDLGDQLRAAHGLALPVRGIGQRDLGALAAGAVGRVGVAGVEADVVGGVARAVDVPLVVADLVGPGPVLQGGDGHVVEATTPYGGAGGGEADELSHEGSGDRLLHHFGDVYCKVGLLLRKERMLLMRSLWVLWTANQSQKE